MFGIHDLPLFIVSGLLLSVSPGPDVFYIATRSLGGGFRAGTVATLGIATGCLVHIFAATAGITAILAASAAAFTFVKLLGAGYLVYVGLSLLRSKGSVEGPASGAVMSLRQVYLHGVLTNVLNPKVALFFLAFLPQFIEPASSQKALAFFLLGTIFSFNGVLWCFFVAWASSRARRITIGDGVKNALNRVAGSVFVLLGLRLALSER